ncbi:MAG: serpin family protein [Gemmatimonadota bacterium]|jgi:serine protease inhibitor
MSSQRWASGALMALLLTLLVAVIIGCGDAVGPANQPIDELPRNLTAPEMAVIANSNAFGLELWREVAARDERTNLVLSPLSASMALGMTLNGAAAETFDAMRSTLGFGTLSQEEINEAYSGLIELLTTLDPDVVFTIANSVWANDQVTFHEAFLQAVAEAFDAQVESRDFSAPSTLDEINAWVDQKTQGKIDRILEELRPELVMLLLNAIYFDGAWQTRFDPADTRTATFFPSGGGTVDVEMMTLENQEVPFAATSEYAAVELPYGGGPFAMLVVVPSAGTDARTFLQGLTPSAWESIAGSLSVREVDAVSIPRWTLNYDGLLNDALKAMGMDVAFGTGADFTNMSPAGDQFCISFVRQKTFIEVDEEGTTAAAVTAVGVALTSFTGIIADRPFLFAIRERLSGTLLFVGLVGDPTQEDSGPALDSSDCR